MPFLLQFVNQIKHESALQSFTRAQCKQPIPLPVPGIHDTIRRVTGGAGLRGGEILDLYGPSGGGKSWVLWQFVKTSAQALATLQGLDEWLYRHPDEHVTLVILDGAAPAAVVHDLLKSCQAKWGFVLMTATPSFEDQQRRWYDYRFHVYKENNTVKMRLVWPPTTTPSDVISCEFQ